MRIFLNEIVHRSKVLFTNRYNGNHSSSFLCKKYSSNLDRIDNSAKNELPAYIATRLELWNQLKEKYDEQIASKPPQPIKIRLADGTTKDALAWKSTPYEVVNEINAKLLNRAVVARVNGTLWDLKRPLQTDCTLELIQFDDKDGREVFWHSSAHVLGGALELLYGGLLCTGPPIENGFYYDMFTNGVAVTMSEFRIMRKENDIHFYFRYLRKTIHPLKRRFSRLSASGSRSSELKYQNRI